MAKLRHLAIAARDPDATAAFYVDGLGFRYQRRLNARWGHGHVLTDGWISLSILRYTDNGAAGADRGIGFEGLHHVGFEVDDVSQCAARVEQAGGRARRDITDALGISPGGIVDDFEGPDGVVFDVGAPGVWTAG